MATDQDFDDFTVTVVHKPVAGVTNEDIPEKLAAFLSEGVKTLLREDGSFDPDRELTVTAKDEAQAKRLAGYARAWGARQEPKLRITKVPNGKRYPDTVARLSVAKEDEVPAENRPGRKAR